MECGEDHQTMPKRRGLLIVMMINRGAVANGSMRRKSEAKATIVYWIRALRSVMVSLWSRGRLTGRGHAVPRPHALKRRQGAVESTLSHVPHVRCGVRIRCEIS